ncbi:PREDICTED: sialin-like [Priapulus caudatus]|uniref:Sialin-like n=1 Tax=Priapulus caudatus TaxID=37621 RepID=A0ABM1ES29_PRICU|nr:PREDICTED: sialin-like [Priapulus caudatus]
MAHVSLNAEYEAREPLLAAVDESEHEEGVPRSGGREKPESGVLSARHTLAMMMFLGFFNVYALRVNLSVALLAMVNVTMLEADPVINQTDDCPSPTDNVTTGGGFDGGTFYWDSEIQGIILGSFFYGYIFTQLPGGRLAEKYGAKWVYGLGVLCTTLFTFLTPLAANTNHNVAALVASRVIMGLGEGVTFPAAHALWSNWAPPLERSKLIAFSYAGCQLGTVVAMPLSGLLCEYWGWPSVFYVFGSLGVVWFVLWAVLIRNFPEDHPRISTSELNYIQSTLGQKCTRKSTRPPWKSIFTSLPVLAISVGHICNNWGFYTMLICLPTYMKEVLKYDISKDGFVSALPYLMSWIVMILSGFLADYLRERDILSTVSVRKIWMLIGQLSPAAFLVAVAYVGCNNMLAVACLTMAVGMSGFVASGYNVNHLDIAPLHAGTLMGITNTLATLPGIFSPLVVGVLTANPSRHQWQIVFYIAAAVYTFGCLFFLVFASATEQVWAKGTPDPSLDNVITPDGEVRNERLLIQHNSCHLD